MNLLFLGMLLVFLDVSAAVGGGSIDVLPDLVGYLLMLRGLGEISDESPFFGKIRPLAQAMVILSAVLMGTELFAVTVYGRFWHFCLGLAAMISGLLIGFWIVSGMRDMERRRGWDLEGEKLSSMWLCAAVIQSISCFCRWIPVVGQIGALGELVMEICFLAAFYRSKKLYEAKK